MLFEICAAVRRSGGIVDRSAVADHQQDSPLFGPGKQPPMGPQEGFTVDILLEQTLPHHQSKASPRMAVRLVGALVDNVAKIIEPAGIGWTPFRQPLLTTLPALP